MELIINRKILTDQSTIGEMSINGKFECFALEDKDRGLKDSMSLDEVTSKKVFGLTAIPGGKYEVAITFSDRFKTYLPLIMNVKGFDGIRIHPGNTAKDTEGCILVGQTKGVNEVGQSKLAWAAMFSKLKAVEKKEKIWITIG